MLSVAFKPAPVELASGRWQVCGYLHVTHGSRREEIPLQFEASCPTEELARREFLRRAKEQLAEQA